MIYLQEISRNLIVFEQHAVDKCTYLLTINDQINRSTKQFHILNLHIFFFFSGPFNGEAATEKKKKKKKQRLNTGQFYLWEE